MSGSWIVRRAVFALGGVVLATPAAGQSDFFDQGRDFFLTQRIEGASKHSEALSETPATATIVTREDIHRYGFRTVADVLSFAVPGYASPNDRLWDYASARGLSFFEDFNTRILVMLNGHPLNEPWNNFAGLGREMLPPLDLVERIEIVHGPSALLYGGYSLYGIVNVVTLNGESLAGKRVRASGGSWDTYEAVASWGASGVSPGATEDEPGTPWTVLLAGGYYTSRGESLDLPRIPVAYPVDVDGGTIWGGAQSGTDYERAPFGLLSASRGDLSLQARLGYRQHGEPLGRDGAIYASPYEAFRDTKHFLELKWRPKLTRRLEGSFRVFADRYSYSGQSTYAGGSEYPDLSAYFWPQQANTWDSGGEMSFTYRRGVHLLTSGAEYRYRNVEDRLGPETIDSHAPLEPPIEGGASGHLLVLYLQEEWRPRKEVTLVAGGTFADTRPGASTFLPRFAAIVKPAPNLSIKGLFGLGFRPPSLYEAENQAEPLRPEKMRSAELSLLWGLGKNASLQAYAFDSRLTGLIRYFGDREGYLSLEDAPSRGAGLALQARRGNVHGYLNAAYANGHLEQADQAEQPLPGGAQWLGSAGLSVARGPFTASLLARYFGEQNPDPSRALTVPTGDFLEANLRVQWRTRIAFYPVSLSLDVRNLFDEKGTLAASPSIVLPYIPIPGRSFVANCEVRF